MSARVLLVDDDDSARLTLLALLEDEGFSVTEASTSTEAIALASERWDLVLLDQHIGTVLGSDLVPTFRKTAPAAKIVIVSGSAEDAVSIGDGFFPKGGAFDALLRLLRSLQ